jgi:hypothetical protein
MKRLTARFGRLITASFFIVAAGVVAFLLTPLLYGLWGIDSDLPGLIVVCLGLVICIIGIVRRNRPQGWRLAILILLGAILFLPALSLVVSLIYYIVTGRALGD